jgi:hypothetical protein
MGTISLNTKPSTKPASIFDRNLAYMVERIAGEDAEQTLQMLKQDLPLVRDFHQLRAVARVYLANGCRPLKREAIPSAVDPEGLTGEAKLRFHNGAFLLAENEGLVFRGEEAHGPYSREEVGFMAKRLGAESPTNDELGHIIDPEAARPALSVLTSLDLI